MSAKPYAVSVTESHDPRDQLDEQHWAERQAALEQLTTGEVESIYDYGEQPRHRHHCDLNFEKALHRELSIRAGNFLITGPGSPLALRMRVIAVRCPERGCYLADVFRFPLRDGERFLGMTNTRRGESHGLFLNWAFSDDWRGMPVYLPSSCRHGSARLGTDWLLDCVGAYHRWKHALETVEQFEASLPPDQYNGRNSGVFHPPESVWRPKRRSPAVV